MYKLLTRTNVFYVKNIQNILKDFGIVNPNIARNLRYLDLYTALQNCMSKECSILLPTPSPSTTTSPAVEPLSPTQD
jgi:hypothetical protein